MAFTAGILVSPNPLTRILIVVAFTRSVRATTPEIKKRNWSITILAVSICSLPSKLISGKRKAANFSGGIPATIRARAKPIAPLRAPYQTTIASFFGKPYPVRFIKG
jgi:hypothetical protein